MFYVCGMVDVKGALFRHFPVYLFNYCTDLNLDDKSSFGIINYNDIKLAEWRMKLRW
ncbi:hypothetical protein CDL12_10348 [Handroanthus impetiginosus]|uniref:Uncharacterized protein n=1 Tax=Handroanthus impetiginosus TaxID=429701 RepID=A0A2G9HHL1_9LAMI|nr:hypothetical protein CDL12_10348 [Handroanthus impetiginosus]